MVTILHWCFYCLIFLKEQTSFRTPGTPRRGQGQRKKSIIFTRIQGLDWQQPVSLSISPKTEKAKNQLFSPSYETTESKELKWYFRYTASVLLSNGFFNLDFCWDVVFGGAIFGDYPYFCTVVLWCVQGKHFLPDDTSTVPSFTAFCSAALTQQCFFRSQKKTLLVGLALPKTEQHGWAHPAIKGSANRCLLELVTC